ncbi:MAG: hypothetical protein DRR00_30780 [Candidatus Parabeggiatoa sp. nov. 3]|nr:MAG: hypothetical protein DRR00_30780 [Gammaproteobacteria bacterium]
MKRSNERSEIIAPGGTWGSYKTGFHLTSFAERNLLSEKLFRDHSLPKMEVMSLLREKRLGAPLTNLSLGKAIAVRIKLI